MNTIIGVLFGLACANLFFLLVTIGLLYKIAIHLGCLKDE